MHSRCLVLTTLRKGGKSTCLVPRQTCLSKRTGSARSRRNWQTCWKASMISFVSACNSHSNFAKLSLKLSRKFHGAAEPLEIFILFLKVYEESSMGPRILVPEALELFVVFLWFSMMLESFVAFMKKVPLASGGPWEFHCFSCDNMK